MTLKADDIIEIRLDINVNIPPEDEDKTTICEDDYDKDYTVYYYDSDDNIIYDAVFSIEAGFSSFSNVEEYIEEYLDNDFPEIDKYEIFDVDNAGEYQTAKIKIKSIKG